jgi:hypothetical protein
MKMLVKAFWKNVGFCVFSNVGASLYKKMLVGFFCVKNVVTFLKILQYFVINNYGVGLLENNEEV